MEQHTAFTTVNPMAAAKGDNRGERRPRASLDGISPESLPLHDTSTSSRFGRNRHTLHHGDFRSKEGGYVDDSELYTDKYRTSNILIKYQTRCKSLLDAKMIRHSIISEIRRTLAELSKFILNLDFSALKTAACDRGIRNI